MTAMASLASSANAIEIYVKQSDGSYLRTDSVNYYAHELRELLAQAEQEAACKRRSPIQLATTRVARDQLRLAVLSGAWDKSSERNSKFARTDQKTSFDLQPLSSWEYDSESSREYDSKVTAVLAKTQHHNPRAPYPAEIRNEAVRLYKKYIRPPARLLPQKRFYRFGKLIRGGVPITRLAEDLGIDYRTLRSWVSSTLDQSSSHEIEFNAPRPRAVNGRTDEDESVDLNMDSDDSFDPSTESRH
jgi:transposase-like protein